MTNNKFWVVFIWGFSMIFIDKSFFILKARIKRKRWKHFIMTAERAQGNILHSPLLKRSFIICELFTYFSNFIIFVKRAQEPQDERKEGNKNAEILNDFEMENNWIRLRYYHKLVIWCPWILIFLGAYYHGSFFDGSGAHYYPTSA